MLILLNTTGKQEQPTNIMKYTFIDPFGWKDEEKRILDAFQNDRSLPGVSYLVICHKPGKWWDKKKESGLPYYRHKFCFYDSKLMRGPMFEDDEGNEYETYISNIWAGEELTPKQQAQIDLSFQYILSKSIDEVFHKIHWQPLRTPK